jgi:hypothetical protein
VEDLHAETTPNCGKGIFGNTQILDPINLKTTAFHLNTI